MYILTFGDAIEAMRDGEKVSRKGWNGKGIHIQIQFPDENSKMTGPYIYIDTTVYDNNKNLVSARIRLYSNSGSVGTDSDVIGTYSMVSQGSGVGKFSTWKQTKD